MQTDVPTSPEAPTPSNHPSHPSHPGPGSYDPPSPEQVHRSKDPQWSLYRSPRRSETGDGLPGPGNYNIEKRDLIDRKAPAIALKGRIDPIPDKHHLGPGQYDPRSDMGRHKAPSFSIPKSQSTQLGPDVPGPGYYHNPEVDLTSSRISQVIAFKKGKKDMFKADPNPGPGAYQLSKEEKFRYQSSPRIRFGEKLKDQQVAVPGPGEYQPKASSFSKVGGLISKSQIKTFIPSDVPGPGSYNGKYQVGRLSEGGHRWSRSPKLDESASPVPGPGSYEFKETDRARNKGLFSKLDRGISLDRYEKPVPGPGHYLDNMYDSLVSRTKGLPVSKEPRLPDYKGDQPGPGHYNPKIEVTKGSPKHSKISRFKWDDKPNDVPGPGFYSYRENYRGNFSFSKDEKLKGPKAETPGPGQYQHKIYFADVPKYVMASKQA